MDTGRLLLAAALILAPPLAWTIAVIVYNARRRARRVAERPTVSEVIDRASAETPSSDDAGQPLQLDPGPRVPLGWHWPTRDPDIACCSDRR